MTRSKSKSYNFNDFGWLKESAIPIGCGPKVDQKMSFWSNTFVIFN